jgi:hypothetical protein
MTAGRPTKYTPEFIATAQAYIDGGWAEQGDVIPSIAGLSVHTGISRETLRAWSHEEGKEQFSAMLASLLARQENILLQNGLANNFSGVITKLVLSKHGYSDKVEQDVTSGGEKITPAPIDPALASALAKKLTE